VGRAWLSLDLLGHLCLRARIFFRRNDRYSFEHTIRFREAADSRLAPLVPFRDHLAGLQPVQHVEEIVRVAAHQGSGKHGDFIDRTRQGSERIALSRIVRQFMRLIRNAVVEEISHVQANHVIPIGPMR